MTPAGPPAGPPATAPGGRESLIRCYPAEWRERYGPEILAMVDDTLGGRKPGLRLRAQLMRSGLHERLRAAAVIGDDRPAGDRCRAGATLVLIGWATLVVGGSMFAKATEHWKVATTASQRSVAAAAFVGVHVAAAVSAAAVVLGVLASVPALRRALVAGGWGSIKYAIRSALVLSGVGVAATAGLAAWAHHLSYAQRNGVSVPYTVAFLALGVLFAVIVASWVVAGLRAERIMQPSVRLLRLEWAASTVAAIATVVATAAMVTWWAAIAARAPWVLQGLTPGSRASWWSAPMATSGIVATVALVAAVAGLWRLGSSARAGLWSPPAG